MSNWDDDDWEALAVEEIKPTVDEEEEEDDDEPIKKQSAPRNQQKQVKQATKAKDKKGTKAAQRAAATTEAKTIASANDDDSSKKLIHQREVASDYDATADLFADSGERSIPEAEQTFETLRLQNQKDLERLNKLIVDKLSPASELPFYLPGVRELFKQLLANQSSDDVKDVVRVLNSLASEKLTAEKSRPKKKKVFVKRINKEDDLEEGMVDGEYDAFM